MRRPVVRALVVSAITASVVPALCAGALAGVGAARPASPIPAVEMIFAASAETAHPDHPDTPDSPDHAGDEDTKPLKATSILLTLAVIVAAGLGVVLAALGYFTRGRRSRPVTPRPDR